MTKILTMILAVSLTSAACAAEGIPSTSFGISLPTVNESAIGYGKDVSGAVSDKLYYTLGGGSVISQPATRSLMRKIGMDLGWSSDLMCGNFDLKTTVGNQLNGISNGYKSLMGEVIQGATGAVASLPAMMIQRANPGLYDMLTNGVLQANVAFDKSQLNCQKMSKRIADFAGNNVWIQSAMADEYRELVNDGDADAVRVNDIADQLQGNSGHNWVGGQKRGGEGQPAIRPTYDLTAAGFNMMNSLPVLSTERIASSGCSGGSCTRYGSSEEAAKAVVKVLGDISLRTCSDASRCTSGDEDQQPGASQAGTGFAPVLEETIKENTEQLVRLVNGIDPPSATNLAKLRTGSLPVTAGVIKALQRDPDNAALTVRLAGELAMAETVETALIMRRMIVTGMSEPNVAAQTAAIEAGDRRLATIDREIAALRNEMELKRELARNSVLTIIERENVRVQSSPYVQSADSTDSRFNRLAFPEAEKR